MTLNQLGFGMLTVGIAKFHWLDCICYFSSVVTDSSVFNRSNSLKATEKYSEDKIQARL